MAENRKKTNTHKKGQISTVTDSLEKKLMEAAKCPLKKCKRKIHDIESED
jgi:hypothetical protein